MKPKFKKGDKLRCIIDFEKVVVERVDINIHDVGEENEKTKICYWNKINESKVSKTGYSEKILTKINCKKSLLKAKEIVAQNNFEFALFDVLTEANKLVQESLKLKFQSLILQHI